MNEIQGRASDPDTPDNLFGLPIVPAPDGAIPDNTTLLISRLGTDEHGRARISAVKINGLPDNAPLSPASPPQLSLANALRDTTANLAAYIEQRAQEIAAPRIAEIEQTAAERLAEAEAGRATDAERYAGMEHELRRRITHLEKQCNQLAWIARYLPTRIRSWAFGATSGRHPFDRPRDSFADGVDRTAAALGLTPYAEEAR